MIAFKPPFHLKKFTPAFITSRIIVFCFSRKGFDFMYKNFFVLFVLFIFIFQSICFAASDPKLIKTINNGLTKIKEWIIKLSTPAAAVAIGTGVLMKKFSFGDEERIVVGKKLIKSTIFSYAFILSVDLVLSVISNLING